MKLALRHFWYLGGAIVIKVNIWQKNKDCNYSYLLVICYRHWLRCQEEGGQEARVFLLAWFINWRLYCQFCRKCGKDASDKAVDFRIDEHSPRKRPGHEVQHRIPRYRGQRCGHHAFFLLACHIDVVSPWTRWPIHISPWAAGSIWHPYLEMARDLFKTQTGSFSQPSFLPTIWTALLIRWLSSGICTSSTSWPRRLVSIAEGMLIYMRFWKVPSRPIPWFRTAEIASLLFELVSPL